MLSRPPDRLPSPLRAGIEGGGVGSSASAAFEQAPTPPPQLRYGPADRASLPSPQGGGRTRTDSLVQLTSVQSKHSPLWGCACLPLMAGLSHMDIGRENVCATEAQTLSEEHVRTIKSCIQEQPFLRRSPKTGLQKPYAIALPSRGRGRRSRQANASPQQFAQNFGIRLILP